MRTYFGPCEITSKGMCVDCEGSLLRLGLVWEEEENREQGNRVTGMTPQRVVGDQIKHSSQRGTILTG